MKKMLVRTASAFGIALLFALLAAPGMAQDKPEAELIKDIASLDKLPADATPNVIPENAVNSSLVRNFRHNYPTVTNEKWNEGPDHYYVTFHTGSVKTKIVFDKNGKTDYTLKMYGEKQLPSDVRLLVRSLYYDHKVTHVQQLDIKRRTIYVIQLEDKDALKTLRVSEGEVEEIGNIRKAK
jgi:hypothetical protein